MVTAIEFIKNGNQTFRKKIDGCLVSFSNVVTEYRNYILRTPEEERRKTPKDFLDEDIVLKMMVESSGCRQEALEVMKGYSEMVFD